MRIRPATAADLPWILDLVPRLHEFGPPSWRTIEQMNAAERADLTNALARPDDGTEVFLVIERLGFLYATTRTDFFTGERHAHIKDIVVAKDGEGRGVGRELLAAAEEWAKSKGHRLITLSVFPANERAVKVYRSAGYETDVLLMLKRFGDAGD